jgi:hypothetical protein
MRASLEDVEQRVKERIRRDLNEDLGTDDREGELSGPDTYLYLFSSIRVDGPGRITVPTHFLKSWIRRHYAIRLLVFMRKEGIPANRLIIKVDADRAAAPQALIDARDRSYAVYLAGKAGNALTTIGEVSNVCAQLDRFTTLLIKDDADKLNSLRGMMDSANQYRRQQRGGRPRGATKDRDEAMAKEFAARSQNRGKMSKAALIRDIGKKQDPPLSENGARKAIGRGNEIIRTK